MHHPDTKPRGQSLRYSRQVERQTESGQLVAVVGNRVAGSYGTAKHKKEAPYHRAAILLPTRQRQQESLL